jgi:DNA-binding beta-propeller fold protein YncE
MIDLWTRLLAASLFAATVSLAATAGNATDPTGLHVVRRIPGSDGIWDYASFDPVRRRVYVAHQNVVIAIDADTAKANAAFARGDDIHSVVPVPGTDLIVTTNSGDNTAKIISAVDGNILSSLPTSEGPDGAQYDPKSGLVIVICSDAGVLTLIDAKAMKEVGTILVGDHLEFGAPDGKGRFFVNLEDKNQVAVVDLDAGKVVAKYPLPGCRRPTGLAYVTGDRLIADCGNGVVNILDALSGKTIASHKVGGIPDAVIYDDRRALAFLPSAITGTLSVIALSGKFDNTIVDTVRTKNGAATGTLDPQTGRVYLPSAEYILPAPAGRRPPIKPGTFEVLELDRY